MGGYSSIEDLKNDATIRDLIKEAINSVYEMQEQYKESVKEVTKIDVDSDVIGTNDVSSGGGVMIGKGDKGITISQSTNLQTEMQTMYYGNFLSNNDEPIVQFVSLDMLDVTKKDNSESEMPNFYDPVYVMTSLGYNVSYAEFDFENNRIKYSIDYGGAKDQMNEQSIEEFERMNEVQAENKSHNEKYKVQRKHLLEVQKKLEKVKEEYNKLFEKGEGAVKGTDILSVESEISFAQQNVDKDVTDLQSNYLVKKKIKKKKEKNEIKLDPKVEEKLNIVKENTIYKDNIETIKKAYVEAAKKEDKELTEEKALEQLTDNTILSLFNSFMSDEEESKKLIEKYTEEKLTEFSKAITEYMQSYNDYMQSLFLTVIKECLANEANSDDDDYKDLESLDKKYRSDINTLNELKVKHQQLSNQYQKENPDISEQIKTLSEEIKKYNLELSSSDALAALKYYEYYDTDPITDELITKMNKDIDKYKDLMDENMSLDPNLMELQTKSSKLYEAQTFAQMDADYAQTQIQNNKAYQNNLKKLTEGLSDENNEMKRIKAQITSTETYKKAYIEYTKDMYDIQKEYVTISEIVNFSKDPKLLTLYTAYTEEREKYQNSITLYTIVHYSNKDNSKEDVEKLKKLYETYTENTNAAKDYKAQYEEIQQQLDRSDENAAYMKYSKQYQSLRTAKTKFENALQGFKTANGEDFEYKTFDELYNILVSGYAANINEKITNIREKVTNIETNISRSTYNYAQNKITIKTALEDANLKQNNTSIQKMYDGFETLVKDTEKLLANDKISKSTKTNIKSTTNSNAKNNSNSNVNSNNSSSNKNTNFFKKNLVFILITLVLVCLLFLAVVIYYKRKVNSSYMSGASIYVH